MLAIGDWFRKLLRNNRRDHAARVELRRRLDFAVLIEQLDDFIHDFAPFFDMGVFATAKHHGDLNFVAVTEKANGLLDLELNVVLTGLGAKANFFRLNLMRLRLLLLALFVFVFAVVHNAANRGPLTGSHFNQIKSFVASAFERILRRKNT